MKAEFETRNQNIKDLKISNLDVIDEIEKIETRINQIKKTYMVDIMECFDDKGKPVYSNESKRDTRLFEVLTLDDEYLSLKEKLRLENRKKLINQIEIDFQNNLIKYELAEMQQTK